MARIELIDSLKGYAFVLFLRGHVIIIRTDQTLEGDRNSEYSDNCDRFLRVGYSNRSRRVHSTEYIAFLFRGTYVESHSFSK